MQKGKYPQWFIDELVNEEDKEKARNGKLKTSDYCSFKCYNCNNIYRQCIHNHIKLSTGEKKQGCPVCGKVKNHKNRMNTISNKRVYPQWFIDELVNEEDKEKARNGELKNTSYVYFKCRSGHSYKQKINYHIKLSSLERKSGCPVCGKIKNHKNRMNTISNKRVYPQWFIDELVNEEDKEKARNGILPNRSQVYFKCRNGHSYKQIVYDHIKISTGERKYGCPLCCNLKRTDDYLKYLYNKRVYPQWFIDELVNEEDKEKAKNKTLLSSSVVKFKCCNKHIYEQKVSNHIRLSTGERNKGCPICQHTRSKPELEIEEYVKSMNFCTEHKKFIGSNHKLFEVDIFINGKNVGIEYNGSVYHSSENGIYRNLDRLYHYNKFNECQKKNILLITIFDIEWNNRNVEIKRYIKDILEGKENELSYDKEGYMNNNYPSWKNYKNNGEYIEDSYIYNNKQKVYTCGYTKLA